MKHLLPHTTSIILFLYFFSFINLNAQTYDFESDTEGNAPVNITAANGTVIASSHSTEGLGMVVQSASSGNTAVFDLDLFASAIDYSITWKETYTTARRSGFILRANGSNSTNSGVGQGYLFQANSSQGHLRIYRSNATNYTQLGNTVSLTASGTDTPRWYKATVNGDQLIFEYSDDGVNYTTVMSRTDNTYSSGTTQNVIGYGSGVGGMYIDDIEINTITSTPSNDDIYDFESDTEGIAPANITAANGTVIASSHSTEGLGMIAQSASSGNTAVFDLDLFASASDYSITWKETYTTATRSGFILRANGSNSTNLGAGQGYLFQVNSNANNLRVYRSDATSYGTPLVEYSLTASGIDTPRWYKATVNGNQLIFEYSTDGTNYTTAISTTDNTYTSGTTQNVIGYSGTIGGMYIDDIVIGTVTSPPSIAAIYDFESDTEGNTPINITETTGTIEVLSHSTEGKSMVAETATGNAVFDLDLFSTASDYSVTWKETYTTARRNGFILRANGSNLQVPGTKQGYLFQVNSATDNLRIYRSDAGGYGTQLEQYNLTASNIGVSRWYKATVNGNQLIFEYSTDGVNYTSVITITDNTYTTGTTQNVIGFGYDIGGMYVDDITLTNLSTSSIAITNINEYQIFQRDGSGEADILVEGTYTGSPTTIEALWNGNSVQNMTIDANGSGTFSGTLSNQSQGQGTLEVKFSNDNLINHQINYVGIGDVFVIAGQSNASGRGNTLNTYTHATLKATLFGNDDNWKELADATDSSSGQIDGVSSDGGAKGTPWPLIATQIMASQNVPVAFIPTAKGGTSILQWQPSMNHSDASTLYGSMNRRINAIGGNIKGVLFFQGESDASQGTTQSNYETRLNIYINTVESDFPGTKTIVGQIGHSNYNGNNDIRAGQIAVINANSNGLLGPATYDIDLSDESGDTLHFKSDADMQEFANRWYKSIAYAYYSSSNGYGPVVDLQNISYDEALNKITVLFTGNATTVIDPSSTVAASSFKLENNGIISISSVVIVGNTIELTPSSGLNLGQAIILSYASLNDGVSKAILDSDGLPAQPFYSSLISDVVLSNNQSELMENMFSMFPNPVNTELNIKLGKDIQVNNLSILNITGQLVLSVDLKNEDYTFNIDVSTLNSGTYIIRIKTENDIINKKLIKY